MENLKLIAKVFFTCLVLIQSVSSTLQPYEVSGGKIYHIETELQYNWYQAWHECARIDSHLVIIDSAAKNNEIIDLLKKVVKNKINLWLGGNDEFSSSEVSKRSFFWSATGQKFNYTYWSERNPSGNTEHCVHIWDVTPSYQWNDIHCTAKMGFICEKFINDLEAKCEAVKQIRLLITNEFEKAHKQQSPEINSRIQNVDIVEKELGPLQATTQASVQKIFDEQHNKFKELTERMLKQVNDLNAEIRKSTSEKYKQLAEVLQSKLNEFNKFC